MKIKNVVSIVLLLFVVVSVVYLVAGESRSQSEPNQGASPAAVKEPEVQTPQAGASPVTPQAANHAEEDAGASMDPAEPQHKLIAYYFHRTQRCRTCLKIEAYAEEALKDTFPEALQSGELEWHVVNVEEPQNEHFVQDYELASSSLVLVDTSDGAQLEWRNLDSVWELVGDELEFKAYVAGEAMAFLE
ncbi:MAG: hypothetical protein JSU63_07715 [Phycisphaerales bacterium]|nr:MAG: hypothetical protein JSU63_07715 [Phycisphaerales bacterium]